MGIYLYIFCINNRFSHLTKLVPLINLLAYLGEKFIIRRKFTSCHLLTEPCVIKPYKKALLHIMIW